MYIKQHEGFLLSENEDYIWRLKRVLHGLKQAPRAWYSILDKYLQHQGFKRGTIDRNIYINIVMERC